jgi:hypothetical protein
VTLGLAPSRDVPWSEVFAHEVTLAGPALLAEAMPEVGWTRVRDATLAHALAVLDAFACDRIADRQIEPTLVLEEVLAHARQVRDLALTRVFEGTSITYAEAALEMLEATRAEHAALREKNVAFDRYLAIARGKQRLGFPASVALARAAGWSVRGVACVVGVLDGVTLGLQLHDDVIDWEDDLARGGAWAACLGGLEGAPLRERDRATVRAAVHRSGALVRMLAGSARHFRAARRRASLLGARRLADWAGIREAAVAELAQRERGSPGFANRAQALTQWSKTVLQ